MSSFGNRKHVRYCAMVDSRNWRTIKARKGYKYLIDSWTIKQDIHNHVHVHIQIISVTRWASASCMTWSSTLFCVVPLAQVQCRRVDSKVKPRFQHDFLTHSYVIIICNKGWHLHVIDHNKASNQSKVLNPKQMNYFSAGKIFHQNNNNNNKVNCMAHPRILLIFSF